MFLPEIGASVTKALVESLLEQSSLGTPNAQAIRDTVSITRAEDVVAAANAAGPIATPIVLAGGIAATIAVIASTIGCFIDDHL